MKPPAYFSDEFLTRHAELRQKYVGKEVHELVQLDPYTQERCAIKIYRLRTTWFYNQALECWFPMITYIGSIRLNYGGGKTAKSVQVEISFVDWGKDQLFGELYYDFVWKLVGV